jgi:hypothetical protein
MFLCFFPFLWFPYNFGFKLNKNTLFKYFNNKLIPQTVSLEWGCVTARMLLHESIGTRQAEETPERERE